MLVMPTGYDTALLRLNNPVHEHQLHCNTVCLYTSVHMPSLFGKVCFCYTLAGTMASELCHRHLWRASYSHAFQLHVFDID